MTNTVQYQFAPSTIHCVSLYNPGQLRQHHKQLVPNASLALCVYKYIKRYAHIHT